MRRTIIPAAAVIWFATMLTGCGAANRSGAQVTEAQQRDRFTCVYVEIDPTKASLPWTLVQNEVRLIRDDGGHALLAGIAPKGKLVMGLPGIKIAPSGDANVLAFELIAGELLQIVAPLEREPRPGEIVLAFEAPRDQAVRIEIKTNEGQTIALPVPK